MKEHILNSIKKVFFWIFSAFTTKDDGGSSARKWTAFGIMICVFKLHKYHITEQNASTFLMYDYIAIGVLLGLVTTQQLLNKKLGSDSNLKTDEKYTDNV